MGKLQLIIKNVKVTEWDIFPPSFSKMNFEDKCDAHKKFIENKAKELFAEKFRPILKYDSYEICYVLESRGNKEFLGMEYFEIENIESCIKTTSRAKLL